jgi:hypothetical protein
MDNQIIIFSACDQRYFSFCIDLINSLKAAYGAMPRMRVLDVGLLPNQIAEIADLVEAVIEPGWDIGTGMNLPASFRAMTSRPCLPRYVSDAAIIVWIDCDAWVQSLRPLSDLIASARNGRLAIVEERFGSGIELDIPGPLGSFRRVVYGDPATLKANIRACYRRCFGPEIESAFGDLPLYNSGVFALRADSPAWRMWQESCAHGLSNFPSDRLVEQQALTVAIRQRGIPISAQPSEANFACGFELPWFSIERKTLTLPKDLDRPIGVVHLHDIKHHPILPIPYFPSGSPRPTPLVYRAFREFVAAHPANPSTWSGVRRNEPCPCGSGKRFKHCHGMFR